MHQEGSAQRRPSTHLTTLLLPRGRRGRKEVRRAICTRAAGKSRLRSSASRAALLSESRGSRLVSSNAKDDAIGSVHVLDGANVPRECCPAPHIGEVRRRRAAAPRRGGRGGRSLPRRRHSNASLRFFFFYDGDVDTRTLFDDFLMKEILARHSDNFFGTTNFLTIFLFEDLSGRRTSQYRRRPGFSSPSMPLLVFWPHAGARGAGVILPPCAQLLWCELYVMKSIPRKGKKSTCTEYALSTV